MRTPGRRPRRAPYNQKTITRHYGFGATQGTGSVTHRWRNMRPLRHHELERHDRSRSRCPTGVPDLRHAAAGAVPAGSTSAQCGQLVITAANGKQSIDAVTVTDRRQGADPRRSPAPGAIDASRRLRLTTAHPGDLIIVHPGHATHEMLLMWKPVRLQGVGAASSIINANTHPAGKLDPWRRQVNCLFGLALDGTPYTGCTRHQSLRSDRRRSVARDWLDVLRCRAQQSAGRSLAARGHRRLGCHAQRQPGGAAAGALADGRLRRRGHHGPGEGRATSTASNPFGAATRARAGIPDRHHAARRQRQLRTANTATASNPFPSNFQCNPSRIDGLGITNSSQGGGGIFVHGWGHNLRDRQQPRSTTMPERCRAASTSARANSRRATSAARRRGSATPAPGLLRRASGPGRRITQLPYCFNLNVNVHHNAVTSNSSHRRRVVLGHAGGGGRRHLLHRRRLLQVQLQLGLRQPEHGRRRRRRSPRVQLQRRHRAQLDPVQPEHQPDHPDQRRRHRGHGRAPTPIRHAAPRPMRTA